MTSPASDATVHTVPPSTRHPERREHLCGEPGDRAMGLFAAFESFTHQQSLQAMRLQYSQTLREEHETSEPVKSPLVTSLAMLADLRG